jgi:Na+/H+-dicarboxylate symporter
MLGLSAAAWVIILTAVATYIALFSAWLMALPAQRAAVLQGNITAIEAELSNDVLLREAQETAIRNMKQRAATRVGRDRGLVRRGFWLLILSVLIFSAALGVQLRTDAAFKRADVQGPG